MRNPESYRKATLDYIKKNGTNHFKVPHPSMVGKPSGMSGKKFSKETLELFSKQRKGVAKNLTQEQIKRKSNSIKGSKNPQYGKPPTEAQWKGLLMGQKMRYRYSSIHLELIKIVEELEFRKEIDFKIEYFVQYEGHYGRFLDIAFPRLMIDIEADGEYWHDPIEDVVRDIELKQRGWRTYRFTETEISYSKEKVKQRLKEILKVKELVGI